MAKEWPIERMHREHGRDSENACGDCRFCVQLQKPHFARGHVMKSYCFKAPARLNAHGETMRPIWLKRWTACGLHETE